MNSYTIDHLKKTMAHHSATFLATLFSMSMILSGLSLILLARQNLVTMAERWGQDSEITAYLDEELSEKQKDDLKSKIGAIKEVSHVAYVSKSESAARFLKRMGHLSPDFIQSENSQDNPLPATFDIKLEMSASLSERPALLSQVATQISTHPGVTEVSFGQGWIDGWSKFLTKFNILTLSAIGFVLLLGLLIVGNATRVSMERRIEEIEVLELVGATASWIRRPFLIEGALLGFLSGVVSITLSQFLNGAVIGYFSDSGMMWLSEGNFNLGFMSMVMILALGFSFGLFGAYICVRNINTGWQSGDIDVFD